MAKVILDANETYTVASASTIFGAAGSNETVKVLDGAAVTFGWFGPGRRMKRFLRGAAILWVVFRFGLDGLLLDSFNKPWLRMISRIVSIGRNLDAPRGQRLREALESLRDLYGYDFRVQGNRITVMSNAMQTRVFQVNYLAGRRQGSSDVRVTSSSISVVSPGASTSGSSTSSAQAQAATAAGTTGAGAGATRAQDSSRIYTSQDADFWTELKTALGAIVGTEDGRSVIINAHSGVILVRAMPGELRNVEQYLRATQAIIERQVMLEAKIIDVALSDAYQSGINWASFSGHTTIGVAANGSSSTTALSPSGALTSAGTTVSPGAGGALAAGSNGFFGLAFRTKSFAALLNFLETQGNTQVLSSPRIATLNNQKAVLKVGTDEYYVTNVSSTTIASTTTTTTPTVTLQPFFSGIALDVTPQIDDDSMITLHIHPSIAVVTQDNRTINLGAMGNYQLPLASSDVSETDSIVRVRDGNIVAIGGLMRQEQDDTRSGLPGMSTVFEGSRQPRIASKSKTRACSTTRFRRAERTARCRPSSR